MNKGTFGAFSGRRKPRVAMVPIWESPDTGSYTLSTHVFWNHGLNFLPKFWVMGVRVIGAFDAYAVGMELPWPLVGIDSTAIITGIGNQMPYASTTRIGALTSDTAPRYVASGSAYTFAALTIGNLRPFARVFG